jgi:PAS domain S-box-containing protein
MAERVRAYDWASTTLGPIDSWPQSLRTVVGTLLLSTVPIVMLWGEDGVMIYNDAYSVFAGGRHPQLLGSAVRTGWPEVADFNDNVMRVGLAGGTLAYRDQELTLYRRGVAEQVWMNLDYSPILDESGRPAGVMAIVVETTERVLADRALLESDARKALLLRLLQAQRESGDAEAMMQVAAETIARHLGVARAGFFEVEAGPTEAGEIMRLGPCFSDGALPALSGTLPAADIGSRFLAEVRAGRTLGVADVTTSPLTTDPGFANSGTRAFIRAPIFRNGAWRAGMFVHHPSPRPWSDADIGLVREAADHTWDAVERARAVAALRKSEEQLRLATEAAEIALWDVDLTTGTMFWPARARAMLDIGTELPASVRDFYDSMRPDNRARAAAAFAAAIDPVQRAVFNVEFRTVGRHDGGERWIAAKGRGIFDASGLCVRVLGTAVDISERKRTEARLRELNETLERRVAERTAERDRVWRNSRDLLAVVGADGIFRNVNPAWTRILGHQPQDIVGHSFHEFVWPEDAERTQVHHELAVAAQDLTNFENRYRAADGTPRWVSWHTSVEGDLVFAYGRDVTEVKQQQAILVNTEEALRQAQKMEAVGQLTGGLAHDFNNLLTGISGSLEMIRARIAKENLGAIERYITAAMTASKRASALTHRLLAFSRRQTLDPKPTDVNRLIAGMEELIRRSVGPSVHMEVVGAGGLWPTLVDPNQLENALLNLCINARDAMPEGGRLTIETANKWLDERAAREQDLPPGQYVSLCVTDTGSGMTPEVVARAFDPFFTTKPFGEGTGLGLSMIYGFARQSGGQIRVYTEVGKGTTMCLYLPRHDQGAGEEAEAEFRDSVQRTGDGKVVLVIDDEPTIRMLVAEVLEEAGYGVVEAADGPAGLKVLQSSGRIDLLVTDVGLPGGLNGRQVADAARVLRPDLKVMFITGYAENAAIGHGHLEKGMRVITKPFEMEDLARKLGEMMEG